MKSRLVLALAAVLTTAGTAHAQGKRSGALLPGGDAKQPINIEATKLDYFDKEQKLVYTGSVVATQGASKLKSSILTIFLAPKSVAGKAGVPADGAAGAASSNQVQHMVAVGPVTMVQHDQVGTGDNAVYDRAADTVVVTGNVTLSQGPNVTKGDKLTYDLKAGQAVVTGRVKSMFQTGSDVGTPAAAGPDLAPAETAPKRGLRKPASR